MKNVLHIISSPRGEESISVKLGNAITAQVAETFPGSSVTQLDLTVNPFPHIDGEQIKALRTPADLHTAEHKALLKRSDDALAQLFATDIIVIGAPIYNFGIPSTLKSWLDNVVRAGQSFTYASGSPEGLIKGKKAYIAVASGAVFSEGPYTSFDFAISYLKGVLNFIGITDIEVIRAEGLGVPTLQETALDKAISAIAV
ncbi:FMN-dependent NADH-azoreductase [Flavobacterium psychrotrophum]|uniref:FMN-dependent NADH-azoreductase n=1 Tax=Flavobacterium psychrotrophum TaxID=2294119 RepID=UPI000E324B88|nr:NAD(P)H-dependent oxidoreductase [Flavobacterium psychrotrophum]